jgi:hypothetical protein
MSKRSPTPQTATKVPRIPEKVIREIAGLAGIEEPDRIASLGRRLRWWIASSSVQVQGFQTMASGVVGNRSDRKAAGRLLTATETVLRELANARPSLAQRLLHGAADTRAYGPPSWARWGEANATLHGQAFAARESLSGHDSNQLRDIRRLFWIVVDISVSECGGRLLTFSEAKRRGGQQSGSLVAVIKHLTPYLPDELHPASARAVWNWIKRSGVNKHRK